MKANSNFWTEEYTGDSHQGAVQSHPLPYEFRSSEFAWHAGCQLCCREVRHTLAQHCVALGLDDQKRLEQRRKDFAGLKTVGQIIAECSVLTDEQRSLVWSPMPPPEPMGAHDCRVGGDCGLDLNHETRRSRWVVARYRWLKEQKKLGGAL